MEQLQLVSCGGNAGSLRRWEDGRTDGRTDGERGALARFCVAAETGGDGGAFVVLSSGYGARRGVLYVND